MKIDWTRTTDTPLRRMFRVGRSLTPERKESYLPIWIFIFVAMVAFFVAIPGCGSDEAWGDWIPDTLIKEERLLEAIFKAEGGHETNFPYGIKSVRCKNGENGGCREVCKRTIRNNIKRWQDFSGEMQYLLFLARRYAPIGAENDRQTNLNGHWLKNVKWFLNNPKDIK